jgi:hypothetical protein
MMIDKQQAEVDSLKKQASDDQAKLNDEQIMEKKIRNEINQEASVLYDQKVNEMRM